MMEDMQQIKQQYIASATISAKALAEGDYKTANKQAKIQNKIFRMMEAGKVDINILVELLDHKYIGVSTIAAIDLLRIHYSILNAEETLKKIASSDETSMGIDEKLKVMAAQIQLKSWKGKGYVS
jgi:hypothetical protein